MAEHLRLINPDPAASPGRFVMTETATDILRSLRLVQGKGGGAMTLIATAPGMGKTETMFHFKHQTPRCIIHTAVAGEASPWSLAFGIMRLLDLGEPNSRRLPEERDRIAEAITPDGMLIVDEAQNLIYRNPRGGTNFETLEWLRQMTEAGAFSLALIGDLKLLDAKLHLPQLFGRIDRPVVLRRVSKADVAALATRRGLTDARVVEALVAVSRNHALRGVDKVVAHASIFARGGPVELGHIMAAIEDLKLQPKGGK